MYRFSMTALAVVVSALMVGVLFSQGLVDKWTLQFCLVGFGLGLAGFFVAFRTGWNMKAKDPSLTAPMMLYAATVIFGMMYGSATVRSTMGVMLCMILLFGVFRFATGGLLRIAAVFIGAYALMLLALWRRDGEQMDLTLEFGRMMVLTCILPLIAWIGGTISVLRQRLRDGRAFFQTIWDTCNEAVIVLDANGRISYVNPALTTLFNLDRAQALGGDVAMLQSDDVPDQHSLARAVRSIDRHGVKANWETEGRRADGSRLPIEVTLSGVRFNDENMVVVFLADITQRKKAEDQIRHLAHHDPLTGLPNRMLLRDRLQQSIAAANRQQTELWVLFLDFDRFKLINDSLGHGMGDLVLTTLARRLVASCRETDTVARLGGDEFVMVLSESPGKKLTARLVERLMETLAAPMTLHGTNLQLTASIGIAVYPVDGSTADTLLEQADIAMYRAKQNGRNSFSFYTPSMNALAIKRLHLESDLRAALANGEFVLHYQPQLDLATETVVGAEALLRWQPPGRTMVAPNEFIPMAEETGLIVPIGDWVLRTACLQLQTWARDGAPPLRIAVNLSPRQFAQRDLVQTIARILADTGVAASQLELEITESAVMNDTDYAIAQLQALKSLGVHLSIDDFGTGYSSLANLRRFPIDILKIDRSFVADIMLGEDGGAIVNAIITLAQILKLQVVAEGVELHEQAEYLRLAKCDRMQGYLLSKPITPELFAARLHAGFVLPPDKRVAAARMFTQKCAAENATL